MFSQDTQRKGICGYSLIWGQAVKPPGGKMISEHFTGLKFLLKCTPGVYNVHLPIMLESERQAVYREGKKEREK